MKRREFIARTIPSTVLPLLLGGFTFKSYGRSPFLEALVGSTVDTDHVLVLIQLNGGNDGLNTVIPLDQYSALSIARPNILIDETKVLNLRNNTATGLHPAMTGLQSLYQEGKLSILQSVGYPNPSFSHFRATDIWLTGADSNQTLTTGWMGRYLDQEFSDYPNGYPNSVMPDPLAIQIGTIVTSGLQGPNVSMGMALTSPTSFYQLISGVNDPVPNTPAGYELAFVREISRETQLYVTSIKTAASKATNKSALYPTPGSNSLADQLKIVAQLIAGGLKTRIYVVNIGGFDTHANQVSSTGGNETGTHATLLGKLSVAISAFQDDLQLLDVDQRVIGMTFSEFGRRIKSNASYGTDHGTAAPMFVFGSNVSAGIFGANVNVPSSATVNDNLTMDYDFRSVYASVLAEWFSVPSAELQNILLKDYQTIPVVRANTGVSDSGTLPATFALDQNFPNPFNPSTTISYAIPKEMDVALKVYDLMGREVAILVDRHQSAGHHSVRLDGTSLASGTYFYELRASALVLRKKMLLVR